MSGYDLCANRSGKTSNKAVPVISKQGNSELRYALYQAATVAAEKTDLFRAYFIKLLRGRERERGIRTKMRVKRASIPVVRIMLRKKAKVRFEYFLQDIEKILSPPCPSTNDETGSLLLRRLTLAPSFVDGHCQRFSFSFYVLQKNIQSLIPTQSERYFDRWYKRLFTHFK